MALHGNVARASISLLMEDPYGHFGAWNPTGHAAIYFDRVCAETPVQLRRCRPGEGGVVISRYHKVHHDDWLAVGLVPYLYAVENLNDAPTTIASRKEEVARRDIYWEQHLTELIPPKNGKAPKGNWTQLVGSSFDRTSHVFQAPTTVEQDDRFIQIFNDRVNKSHFNLFFHNCADFSRVVLNLYFPQAIHRNYVADFGFTTPKQVARCLVTYGQKHPDVPVKQFVLPQVEGGIARSHRIRGVSESLVKTKRWLFPVLALEPEVIGVSAVAYIATGRVYFDKDAPLFPIREHVLGGGTTAAKADSDK